MGRLAKWSINIGLGLVVLFVISALVLPSALSTRLAIVRSSSMGAAKPAGSLAVMQPVDPSTIEVGDVIAFTPPWDDDVTVSHRVVEVRSNGFVTKGDATEDPDPYIIPMEYVTGKVSWHIPYIGYTLSNVRRFASTMWGLVVLVVLPTLVIFGSAIRDLYYMHSPSKRRLRLLKRRQERLGRASRGAWRLRRAM